MTPILAVLSLWAFAANSILARLALRGPEINPLEFTAIRLLAGAVVLFPWAWAARGKAQSSGLNRWREPLALFLYATFFSLAYVRLPAGVGALVLFASVQSTMIGAALILGQRLGPGEWFGFGLSWAGLVYLLSPGLEAPPWLASINMALAGLAWGLYSVWGRGKSDPAGATARNFLAIVPLALLLLWLSQGSGTSSLYGKSLAAVSGAVTSGLGYLLWYFALQRLSLWTASVLQLTVPLIALIGGFLFLQETLSLRLWLSSALILGGLYLALIKKRTKKPGV
ncbi:MAG: DMT family transporter [bacterium]|nr:DMT family transporter [bacterium]